MAIMIEQNSFRDTPAATEVVILPTESDIFKENQRVPRLLRNKRANVSSSYEASEISIKSSISDARRRRLVDAQVMDEEIIIFEDMRGEIKQKL